MSYELSRRDFVATAGALAGAALLPAATGDRTSSPPADGTVVLFQGDSITDGGRDRGVADANAPRALGAGYPLLVASAALAAHPDRGLRFYNRGVSGNKVPDLEQRWADDTVALKPDVLSILVGVNDFWHKLGRGYTGTVQDYESQYAALLEETRRALPDVRLIVLEPFVLRCGAVDDRWFPEFDERRAAAQRVAQHARAAFVPLQRVFDDMARRAAPQYWAADGVHPTPAGHAVISEHWRRAAHL
ncbi:MAG TPA: SGNH/GDSL hydrolase family protein [Gemmatimonadales bacterium]|nr:SGNH/GDSL hydrolase family protein [Gemmatimonadales bacterium]